MNTFYRRVTQTVWFGLLLCVLLVNAGHAQETSPTILNRPPLAVLDVQYSPDGRYLAQVYAEGRLEVLDTSSNRLVLEDSIVLPNPLLRAKVDWSPTGDRLAAGIGAQIYIWDVETERLLETVEAGGPESLVYNESGYYAPEGFVSLQWDSSGTLLMAKSVSSRYTVWSTEQQAFIVDQVIGNNPVPVVWLAGDQRVSTGNSYLDIQTQEYVVLSTQRLPEATSQCGVYLSISSSSDRTRIAWGTFNGCVIIIDGATGNQIAAYKIAENGESIRDVNWSSDDSAIVTVSSMGSVQVLDVATSSVTMIAQQDGSLYAVDWADDNSAIAYGGNTDGEAAIFATVSVAEVEQLMATEARQPEFAITPATDR